MYGGKGKVKRVMQMAWSQVALESRVSWLMIFQVCVEEKILQANFYLHVSLSRVFIPILLRDKNVMIL
jgi:hypothetical protein